MATTWQKVSFSADEIGSLENEFDRIVRQLEKPNENDPNHNGIISTRNVQQYSSLWLAALLHKGFLDIVEQFIGPDIVLNHSTLFEKRKTTADTPFKMHQDWSYLPTQQNTIDRWNDSCQRSNRRNGVSQGLSRITQTGADGEFKGGRS